jgi:hypothetical protein
MKIWTRTERWAARSSCDVAALICPFRVWALIARSSVKRCPSGRPAGRREAAADHGNVKRPRVLEGPRDHARRSRKGPWNQPRNTEGDGHRRGECDCGIEHGDPSAPVWRVRLLLRSGLFDIEVESLLACAVRGTASRKAYVVVNTGCCRRIRHVPPEGRCRAGLG